MNPQETQQQQGTTPQINPDQVRSALGFATMLQQQHLQSQMPPQTPQNAPQQEQSQEMGKEQPTGKTPKADDNKMTKLELDMTKKIDDLRKELDEKHKLEIDQLRNDIKEAIDNEQD
jgi:hypothetical protein